MVNDLSGFKGSKLSHLDCFCSNPRLGPWAILRSWWWHTQFLDSLRHSLGSLRCTERDLAGFSPACQKVISSGKAYTSQKTSHKKAWLYKKYIRNPGPTLLEFLRVFLYINPTPLHLPHCASTHRHCLIQQKWPRHVTMQLVAEEKRELLCKLILASLDLGWSPRFGPLGVGVAGVVGWLGLVSYM